MMVNKLEPFGDQETVAEGEPATRRANRHALKNNPLGSKASRDTPRSETRAKQ